MSAATSTPTTLKRHPIRGALWGLLLGIGLMLVLVGQAIIAVGTLSPWLVILLGIAIGVLWGFFGPAKKPKGEPPGAATTTEPEEATADAAEPEVEAVQTEDEGSEF